MNRNSFYRRMFAAIVGAVWAFSPSLCPAEQTTAFTYQGQLHDSGTNANGAYTMIFKLYDSSGGGNQIGTAITNNPSLANGLFTVNLDFGAGAFDGGARWLDITITNGGTTETLSPRVQVLSAPYAQFAAVAATMTNGAINSAQIAGGAVANVNLAVNAVNANNIAGGQVVKSLNGLSDVVTLLAGTNMVLTTNGNVLQLSAGSRVVSGVDGNLSIVRGNIAGDGTINSGGGFTVNYSPAGTAGPLVGVAIISGGVNALGISATAPILTNEWLIIGGGFYQVVGVNGPIVTLSPGYGGSLPVNIYPAQLFPTYTVTFTTSFSSPPVVLATANAIGDTNGLVGFSSDWYSVNVLHTNSTSQFQAVVARPPGADLTNSSTHGFDFIAIGQK